VIVEDVSILPERVKRELIRGENARAEFAIRAQTALKEAMDGMGPVRHIDGIGVRRATIHPELAARIMVKFRRQDGLNPLNDPDFLKALLRDNPFLRVQCVPARLTLRVNGRKQTPNAERPTPNEGNGDAAPSRRLEDCPQGSQIAQIGGGRNGARREAATPLVGQKDRGSSLLVSPGPRSGHETPAPERRQQSAVATTDLRQSANSADITSHVTRHTSLSSSPCV
jgi:hypothetical protein